MIKKHAQYNDTDTIIKSYRIVALGWSFYHATCKHINYYTQ